jgi:hypothetical protein
MTDHQLTLQDTLNCSVLVLGHLVEEETDGHQLRPTTEAVLARLSCCRPSFQLSSLFLP